MLKVTQYISKLFLVTLLLTVTKEPSGYTFENGTPVISPTPVHQQITQEALSFLKTEIVQAISDANAQVDHDEALSSEFHFDGCQFLGSSEIVSFFYTVAINNLKSGQQNFGAAAQAFGQLLHPVQDFYSHSNWVELQQAGFALDLVNEEITLWEPLNPQAMVKGVMVAQGKDSDFELLGLELVRTGKIVTVRDKITKTDIAPGLITGTFGTHECPETIALGHWDLPDAFPAPGIDLPFGLPGSGNGLNKDYKWKLSLGIPPYVPPLGVPPHILVRSGHTHARALAVRQTRHEWCRLINLVRDEHGQTAVDELFQNWVAPDKIDEAGCTDMTITMTDSSDPVLPGDTLTYTIEVTNDGPFDATAVTLEDTLPPEVFVNSFTTSKGSCTQLSGTITCAVGDMESGSLVSIMIEVTVNSATKDFIENQAKATANEADTNQDNNSATETTGLKPALAFASNRSGRFQIWKVPISPVGTAEQITTAGGGSQESRAPDWSKNGRIAYQFGASSVRSIYSIKPDHTGNVRETLSPADEVNPSWSSDGRFIAYALLIGGDFDIWIHDITSGQDFPFYGFPGTQETRPAWSPDGTRIAFVTTQNGGDGEIAVTEVDTSSGTPILGNAFLLTDNTFIDFDPTWSHDGAQIAFSSTRSGGRDIYRMSAEFGEGDPASLVRLTTHSAGDHNPAWSPDGKKIAFVSERDGNREIYIMSALVGEADSGSLIRVTDDIASDDDPAWAPVALPPELVIVVNVPPVPSGTGAPTIGTVKVTDASDRPVADAFVTILGPLGSPSIDRLYLTPLRSC
jgi:TolB protein